MTADALSPAHPRPDTHSADRRDPVPPADIRLERRGAEVFARTAPDAEPEPVRLLWLRPIRGEGGAFSIVTLKRRELSLVHSLEDLEPASREVARVALSEQYLVPTITAVHSTKSQFGARIWDVETDHGRRQFSMKDPHINAIWISSDHLMLRDASGNRYDIPAFSTLSPASRAHALRVL
jgi:hypothetical protein